MAESSRKAHLAHSITTINVNPGEKAQGKARLFMAKSRSGSPGKTIFIEQNLGKCLLTQVPEWDPVTLQGTDTYTVKGSIKKQGLFPLPFYFNCSEAWILELFHLFH